MNEPYKQCYNLFYYYFKTIQMRPIERIDNFLEKINWPELFKKWKIEEYAPSNWDNFNKYFLDYWKENPDQRIGQVLINLGIVPDSMEIWVTEESTILIDQGIPPEEVLYWTSMYDEKSELLDEPITRKVSTLTEEHIKRIVQYMYDHNGRISPDMTKAFENMLAKYKEKSPEELPMAA